MNKEVEKHNLCRSTYALIDLKQLGKNVEAIKESSQNELMAVVKADAYGHGSPEVSKYLYKKCGVKYFAVATYTEAVEVKDVTGNDAVILIYGEIEEYYFDEAVSNGFILTIVDAPYAELLNDYAIRYKIRPKTALKIDTGMSRIGIKHYENYVDFHKQYDKIDIVHVYSHLSSPYYDKDFTALQIKRFDDFIAQIKDEGVESSLFASLGMQSEDISKYDYIRAGILMYGYGAVSKFRNDIQPIMSVYSKIIHVQHVAEGDTVGYSRQFIADRDMMVGVVAIGYADGYMRAISASGYMVVRGVRCKVLGTICMDMTMIDIGALGSNVLGETVEVIGKNVRADEIAVWADTISYEIICGISKRVPRIYKR